MVDLFFFFGQTCYGHPQYIMISIVQFTYVNYFTGNQKIFVVTNNYQEQAKKFIAEYKHFSLHYISQQVTIKVLYKLIIFIKQHKVFYMV